MKKRVAVLFLLVLLSVLVTAHVDEGHDGLSDRIEKAYEKEHIKSKTSLVVISVAAVIITILTAISVAYEKKLKEMHKKVLFVGLVIPVVVTTLFLMASTIYVNIGSETGGPVHWHADFEIWRCDQSIDLEDPTGLANRIGTPVFHEHDDFRVHVEGTVIDYATVSLQHFFEVVGGEMTDSLLAVPTNDGLLVMENGEDCNGQESKLQVFVYKVENPDDSKTSGFTFTQEKLEDFESYVLSPYANVPPGDCVIIEMGPEKERTDRMCETYTLAVERGDMVGS